MAESGSGRSTGAETDLVQMRCVGPRTVTAAETMIVTETGCVLVATPIETAANAVEIETSAVTAKTDIHQRGLISLRFSVIILRYVVPAVRGF